MEPEKVPAQFERRKRRIKAFSIVSGQTKVDVVREFLL